MVENARDLPTSAAPGVVWTQDLRLVAERTTDAVATFWTAEEAAGNTATVAVFHPHAIDRFLAVEPALQRWADLDHPRMQRVHSLGRRKERGWVAWWGPPTTLAEEALGGLGTDAALLAVLDVAEALAFAHERELVHGGPTPGWVGLEPDGARLGGFGVAALQRASQDALLYTAPELLDPRTAPTAAGDRYALGMLTLLALYGEALPYWVLRDTNGLIRQLDPEPDLAAALRGLLEWNPEARSSDPQALVDALLSSASRVDALARTALEGGQLDQAERLLDRLDQLNKNARKHRSLRLELARRRAARGAPDDAIRSLVKLAERTTDATPIWLEIAGLYREQGRPDDAASAAGRAWSLHRDRRAGEQALRLLVEVDRGHLEAWVRELVPFVDDHERAELCATVATALEQAGDPEGALGWLEEVEGTEVQRQRLLDEMGDPAARLDELLLHADAQEDEDRRASLELALRAAVAGPADVRLDICRRLLEDGPHAQASRWLARDALARGEIAEAIERFESLVDAPQARPDDQLAFANLLADQGAEEPALALCERILDAAPAHGAALERAAALAGGLGRTDEEAAWRSAWVHHHDDGSDTWIPHLLRAARALRRAGRAGDARSMLHRVLEREPDARDAIWELRLLDPLDEAVHLPLGPREALACVLTPLVATDDGPHAAWTLALNLIDDHDVVPHRALLHTLESRYPAWSEPFAAIAAQVAGHPVAEASDFARWRGRPRHGARRRILPGTGGESSGPPLPPGALRAEAPAPESPEGAPASLSAFLVVGVGARMQVVPLEQSCVLTPTTLPDLPGMLQVVRTRSQTYLAVDEGTLKREGEYAQEVRARFGERITWRGTPLMLVDEPPEEEPEITDLEPLDDLDDVTEPRDTGQVVHAGPVGRLDPDGPALVWEQHGLLRGLTLPEGEITATLRGPGELAFTTGSPPAPVFSVRRTGPTCDLRTGDETRQLDDLESLAFGDLRITFHVAGRNASPADRPTVEMDRPTVDVPWLLVDDGEGGRPVPIRRSPFRLGRGRSCDLTLDDDPMLSRIHCVLEKHGSQWFAVDRSSANGTRVNGLHVSGRSRLEEGDRIELGRSLLLFSLHPPDDVDLGAIDLEEPDAGLEELDVDPDDEEDTRPLSEEEIQAAMVRSRSLASDDAVRMIDIANAALSVLLRALDDERGPDQGRAHLQGLVDSAPRQSLFSGLAIHSPALPTLAVLTRLDSLSPTERRRALETELIALIERSSAHVHAELPAARVAQVDALLEAVDAPRRLRF